MWLLFCSMAAFPYSSEEKFLKQREFKSNCFLYFPKKGTIFSAKVALLVLRFRF